MVAKCRLAIFLYTEVLTKLTNLCLQNKHYWPPCLAALPFTFWVGFYDLVAGGYFEENALHHIPERMDMISIALGALIEAFVLANVYRHWSVSKPVHFCGFEFGVWIGLFVGFGAGLVFYGTAEVHTLNTHLVDAAWNIVYYGFTGLMIAWGYGLVSKKETATD